jgi:predicted permease
MLTALVVLTVGLGLASTTSVFAVVRSVLLQPLPYEAPDRVVAFRNTFADGRDRRWSASFPQFLDLQAELSTVTGVAGWRGWPIAWTADDGRPPRRLASAGATHDLFPILGVEPALGRTFLPEEDVPGGRRTAVVSHGFWQTALGGDASVLGRTLTLDGGIYEVVGVLPRSFDAADGGGEVLPAGEIDVWVPYRNSPTAEGMSLRGLTNVNPVARLADGVSLEEAQSELDALTASLISEYPDFDEWRGLWIPAHEVVTAGARSEMRLLSAAVLLVLLLACMNAATLVLERAESRRRELAVRRALGAGKAQVLRLLLGESIVLAAGGAILAAVATPLLIRGLVSLDPGTLPRLGSAGVGRGAAGVLAVATLFVSIVLALVPAWGVLRSGTAKGLASVRGIGSWGGRLRPSLVVLQVALAFLLLAGSGLLVRSLVAALDVEPGFDPEGLVTVRVDHPTPFVSEEWPQHVQFFQAAADRIREIPGVISASAAYHDPADPGWNNSFRLAQEGPEGEYRGAIYRPVLPGYFETTGIPLQRGRGITVDDEVDGPGIAVVNEAFVERYFPGIDPIGQRLLYGHFWEVREPEVEIVGVVGNVRFSGIETDVPPAIYMPHTQQPVKEMAFVVRSTRSAAEIVSEVQSIVGELDPTLPVFGASTVAAKLDAGFAERRFLVVLLSGFAAVALALAAAGLYGVLSFVVARRTPELGLRLAIGARPATLRRLVLRRGMLLVGIGLAVGAAGSALSARMLRDLLFEVTPADPITLLVVPTTLALVGILACLIPATRATRVDPLRALQGE